MTDLLAKVLEAHGQIMPGELMVAIDLSDVQFS